jgi:hypothetical protein
MSLGPHKPTRLAVLGLAAALQCVIPSTVLADPSAQPAPAAEPPAATHPGLPVLPILGGNHALYVIAIGADASARSKVVASLAERLQHYRLRHNPWILAEPDWSVADYLAQCQAQPQSTDGAVLASIAATAGGASNKFFYNKNWFALDSDAAFITCDASPSGKPTSGIAWDAGVQQGYAIRNTYSQLFSAAALLFAAASTVSTFIPSHTSTTMTTTAFPTSNPIPPAGQTTGKTTSTSTTSNPSSLANSSAALLAPALAFANPAPPAPIVDAMTWNAAEAVVDLLMGRMHCTPLHGEGPTAGQPEAPFCAVSQTP